MVLRNGAGALAAIACLGLLPACSDPVCSGNANGSFGANDDCGSSSSSSSAPDPTVTCEPAAAPAAGEPRVVLGRSLDGVFMPIADGDHLQIEHGFQGGQHFFASVHFFSDDAAPWVLRVLFTDDENQATGLTTTAVDACAGQTTKSDNIAVILTNDNPTPGKVELTATPQGGSPITISASITLD